MRKGLAALFAVLYLVIVGSFWAIGSLAYLINFSGLLRLAGILFLPILALPLVGRGEVMFFDVKSVVWWWWFGLSLVVAAAMLALWPSRSQESAEKPEPSAPPT